jgi:hypothetical protein
MTFNGTIVNRTTGSIAFVSIPNGSYAYQIGPWGDPDACVLDEASESGSTTVAGTSVNISIAFTCSGTGSGTGPGSSGPGLLGLTGDVGYFVILGIVIVVVITGVVVALWMRRPGSRAPPQAYSVPPPPPPPPPSS